MVEILYSKRTKEFLLHRNKHGTPTYWNPKCNQWQGLEACGCYSGDLVDLIDSFRINNPYQKSARFIFKPVED